MAEHKTTTVNISKALLDISVQLSAVMGILKKGGAVGSLVLLMQESLTHHGRTIDAAHNPF